MRLDIARLAGCLVALCAAAVVLAGCTSDPNTPTTTATTSAVVSLPVPTANTTTSIATSSVTTTAARVSTATAIVGSTAPATERQTVLAAIQNFAQVNAYSFIVSQTATLQTSRSSNQLRANGSGLYASGNYSQTVNIVAGGSSQTAEIFLQHEVGYQKLTNLAVWSKLDNSLYKYGAAEPPSVTILAAKTILSQGHELVGSVQAAKYGYSIPGVQLISGNVGLGPWSLGLLSATTILNGFSSDDLKAAQIQETLWLDPSTNLLIQRQTTLQISNNLDTHLNYQVSYTYGNFNQSGLNIPVPQNLP